MRTSFSRSGRTAACLLCLALATGLAGCASKNPLMNDEPVLTSVHAAGTDQVATSQSKASATNASGVTTTAPTGLRRFLGIFLPYRVDIQQGNFVSREMVAQLREGMTREQVRFVLGTPLLTDIFHANRSDYLFRLQKSDGEVISSRVTVFFDNNRLARIEGGGKLPTEKEYLALIAGSAPGANAKSGK